MKNKFVTKLPGLISEEPVQEVVISFGTYGEEPAIFVQGHPVVSLRECGNKLSVVRWSMCSRIKDLFSGE
jgi:hypothetical protein